MKQTSIWILLIIFLAAFYPGHSHAATIYSMDAAKGECFADSQGLSLPCSISQRCTSKHNTHYYYVEISETDSYTFSASKGSITLYNSYGVPVNSERLSPDRYYIKLYTGSYDGTATLEFSKSSQKIQASIPVKKIILKKRKKTIQEGKRFVLKPICKPSSATNQKMRFRSSKKNIASVSSKGVVRGKKAGKATITVSAADNKKIKAKCRITVRAAKKKNTKNTAINVSNPSTTNKNTAPQTKNLQDSSHNTSSQKTGKNKTAVTKIRLSSSLVTLQVGKSTTLHATVLPTNAANKSLSWKSLNPSVASVSNGKIVAKKPGITTIVATSRDNPACSCSCTVSVR